MKKKMPLPESLLDALSGGVLQFQGEEITQLEIYTDGMLITTPSGVQPVLFAEEDTKMFESDHSKFHDLCDKIDALEARSETYDLAKILPLA